MGDGFVAADAMVNGGDDRYDCAMTEPHRTEKDALCEPCQGGDHFAHPARKGCSLDQCSCPPQAEPDRYVVTGPSGFTESIPKHHIETLVAMGVLVHDYDGHVLADGQGRPVGALHHFYKEAQR